MANLKPIEAVIAQYLEAVERGDTSSAQQLLERHPEFAKELSEFAELHERLTASSPSLASVPDPRTADTLPRADSASPSLASNPPKILGDYEIIEEIERGGMGIVYKALDRKLNRVVALKLIRSGELASEEEVQRFLSEAEAAAALTHPGIVPIFEVGTLHGLVFYTMAYIEGPSLAELVDDVNLDPLEAVRIIHKLCAAVECAHQAGVYHRDLKPSNVLINKLGQPIIIDFGLAKNANRDMALTATGQLLGTPAYMAPEQAAGQACSVGPSGDVYALGAILYFLAARQPAFSGPTPFDVLLQVLDRRPPRPSKLNKRVSAQLDAVCMRALEKNPKNRYQTASELAADLHHVLAGEPIESPKESWSEKLQNWWRRDPILVAHLAGIGVTTAIVALFHFWRGEPSPLFAYRMRLLSIWLIASMILQYWVYRARWRQVAIYSWLTVDVVIYTWLIAFASPPRSLLLIGYPMMVVASGLFFQRRFVIAMTLLCIAAFCILGWPLGLEDFAEKPDFSAIFVCGLVVIGLCMLATINRIRGLSRFYHQERI